MITDKIQAERTLSDIACYALCGRCKSDVRRVKIRVRCGNCRREPLILSDTSRFPETWAELKTLDSRGWCPDDLGARGRGRGCGYGQPAQFFMKCSFVNEKTQERCNSSDLIYLDQVKEPPSSGTWSTGCVACSKRTGPMVVFEGCGCLLCVMPARPGEQSCFSMYCKHVIDTAFVSLVPDERTGYISFGCPSLFQGEAHARSLIRDVHHLKLGGIGIYTRYKELAANRITDTTCPWCLCGLVKMHWTEYGEPPMRITCPNSACQKGFCSGRECGAKWIEGEQHVCNSQDSAYVRSIARRCPTPGCRQLHIHYYAHDCHHVGGCPGCHNHFCYLCGHIRNDCAVGCSKSSGCNCPPTCNDDCKCPRCPGCPEHGGACLTHNECRKYCGCGRTQPAASVGATDRPVGARLPALLPAPKQHATSTQPTPDERTTLEVTREEKQQTATITIIPSTSTTATTTTTTLANAPTTDAGFATATAHKQACCGGCTAAHDRTTAQVMQLTPAVSNVTSAIQQQQPAIPARSTGQTAGTNTVASAVTTQPAASNNTSTDAANANTATIKAHVTADVADDDASAGKASADSQTQPPAYTAAAVGTAPAASSAANTAPAPVDSSGQHTAAERARMEMCAAAVEIAGEREQAAAVREQAAAEREKAAAEREQAAAAREVVAAQREVAAAERERAVGQRTATLEEKIAAREAMLAAREAAVAEREATVHAQARAAMEREAAVAERAQAMTTRELSVAERERAVTGRELAAAAREALAAENAAAVGKLHAAVIEREVAAAASETRAAAKLCEIGEREVAVATKERSVAGRESDLAAREASAFANDLQLANEKATAAAAAVAPATPATLAAVQREPAEALANAGLSYILGRGDIIPKDPRIRAAASVTAASPAAAMPPPAAAASWVPSGLPSGPWASQAPPPYNLYSAPPASPLDGVVWPVQPSTLPPSPSATASAATSTSTPQLSPQPSQPDDAIPRATSGAPWPTQPLAMADSNSWATRSPGALLAEASELDQSVPCHRAAHYAEKADALLRFASQEAQLARLEQKASECRALADVARARQAAEIARAQCIALGQLGAADGEGHR